MDERDTQRASTRARLSGRRAAWTLGIALIGLVGYLGWASGGAMHAPRGGEGSARSTGRPPIDLSAPTEFETATFALG